MGRWPQLDQSAEDNSTCFHLQEKFMDVFSQYFKPVPSNPYYYFYCPLSSKRDVSHNCCLSFGIQNKALHKEREMELESVCGLFVFCLVRRIQRMVR